MIERKIIKTRAEINEKEIKETIEKINKAKSWVFEKINKLDKPLTTVIKNKREKTQVNKNNKWNRSYNRQHRNRSNNKRLL